VLQIEGILGFMHEVEVKAGLKDKDAFISALAGIGCELGKEIVQDDTVYVREVGSVETYLSNPDFLRLRVEDSGRVLFTLKHHADRVKNLGSAPLELEVEVSSRDIMEQALHYMGYQEAVRIQKRRRKGRYQNWEVCVDEVEGLGSFVELEELIAENENVQAIQERMAAFLSSVGVDPGNRLRDRYDVLLLQKQS
jgi:adenylate cyclase class 2